MVRRLVQLRVRPPVMALLIARAQALLALQRQVRPAAQVLARWPEPVSDRFEVPELELEQEAPQEVPPLGEQALVEPAGQLRAPE